LHTLGKLCAKHGVNLIAIGNGTASRETDKLAGDLIKLLAKMAAQAGMPEIKWKKWWCPRPVHRSIPPANLPRRKCPMWM
jgi:hypothetical protein